jgi:hypothetical protein
MRSQKTRQTLARLRKTARRLDRGRDERRRGLFAFAHSRSGREVFPSEDSGSESAGAAVSRRLMVEKPEAAKTRAARAQELEGEERYGLAREHGRGSRCGRAGRDRASRAPAEAVPAERDQASARSPPLKGRGKRRSRRPRPIRSWRGSSRSSGGLRPRRAYGRRATTNLLFPSSFP